MNRKLLLLILAFTLNFVQGQKIKTTQGPININYLEYYGISPRLIQTAVFPFFQDQVQFDAKITIHSTKMGDTARFQLNYNPFYELGLDVNVAPEKEDGYELYKKSKMKKLVARNLNRFRRNAGRIFIKSEDFSLVAEGGDNVILRYNFKLKTLPIEYWGLKHYEILVYIEEGVLDKVVLQTKKANKKGEIKKKQPRKYAQSVTYFKKLEGFKGYVVASQERTFTTQKKDKDLVAYTKYDFFNFKNSAGNEMFPEKKTESIDSLNRKDKATTRIRLERKLPVLGRAAMKAGYEVPLPFGVEAFTHWQRELMGVSKIIVNDDDLSSLVTRENSSVDTEVTLMAGKADVWVFPFLNVNFMAGYSLVNFGISLELSQEMKDIIGIIDPDTTINRLELSGPANGPFIGGGFTLAWGYKNFFATVNAMFVYTVATEAKTTTTALALTPLIGYKNRILNIMAGLQYQLYDSNVKGAIMVEGQELKFDVGLTNQKTNFILGIQKDFTRHWNASLLVGFKPRNQVVLNVGYRF